MLPFSTEMDTIRCVLCAAMVGQQQKNNTQRTPKFNETEEMRLRFCNCVHLAAIQRNLLRFLATGDFTSRWIILSFHSVQQLLLQVSDWTEQRVVNIHEILQLSVSRCKSNDFSWPFIDMSLFSDFVLYFKIKLIFIQRHNVSTIHHSESHAISVDGCR